jgi:polar amino acid transport system permease protein
MAWSWSSFFDYLFSSYMLAGAWTTVWLTCTSMAIGMLLGCCAALMKLSRNPILRGIAAFYVWLWRATPLLVQLVIIYTGLPQLGIRLGVVESALIGFGLNEGAYFAELLRAGILSVDAGQSDAARSLGLNYARTMWLVILPQAARVVIPPLGNQFNGLLKTSSLASVISMEELLRHAQELAQIEFRVLEAYLVAAVYYAMLTTLWGQVQKRIERYYGKPYERLTRVAQAEAEESAIPPPRGARHEPGQGSRRHA